MQFSWPILVKDYATKQHLAALIRNDTLGVDLSGTLLCGSFLRQSVYLRGAFAISISVNISDKPVSHRWPTL